MPKLIAKLNKKSIKNHPQEIPGWFITLDGHRIPAVPWGQGKGFLLEEQGNNIFLPFLLKEGNHRGGGFGQGPTGGRA